jgi:predicted enzyme related to lactoylglutathione lyase
VIRGELAVAMRDGARSMVNVFRPADKRPAPVLMSVTPCGKDASTHQRSHDTSSSTAGSSARRSIPWWPGPCHILPLRFVIAVTQQRCGRDIRREPMKIKLTSVYVADQDKALRFYTNVLGFVKKADFSQASFRWLTVASHEEPDGTELQLALNSSPAAKAYQQALFAQGQPAAMFYSDDVQADYERMKARGAEFTMPPTDATGSKIAMLNDTCGNLVQVVQLMRW